MITAAVILILCNGSAGTFTVLENNRYISAEHVGCLRNDYEDAELDFSTGPINHEEGLKFSCERLVTGRKYRLMGYSDQRLRTFELEATPYVVEVQSLGRKNLRGLQGLASHGMSGGPVLNERDEVVAIISTRNIEHNLTLVTELARTPLCENTQ